MKYRIIGTLIVIAVLGILYALTQDSSPTPTDGGMRIGMEVSNGGNVAT